MSKFKESQRVIVDIGETDGWNMDTLSVIQGMRGVIISVKTEHDNGREKVAVDPPRYMVLFDESTARTPRGISHTGFWFDEGELRLGGVE